MQKQKHYEQKRLSKSNKDKSIAGVCAGLAEYFSVDVTIIRLLFVLFTLAGGPGLIVYIALAIVLPNAPESQDNYEDQWI